MTSTSSSPPISGGLLLGVLQTLTIFGAAVIEQVPQAVRGFIIISIVALYIASSLYLLYQHWPRRGQGMRALPALGSLAIMVGVWAVLIFHVQEEFEVFFSILIGALYYVVPISIGLLIAHILRMRAR